MRRARIRFASCLIALCLPFAVCSGCGADRLPRFARPSPAAAEPDAGEVEDEDAGRSSPSH